MIMIFYNLNLLDPQLENLYRAEFLLKFIEGDTEEE